MTWTIDVKTGDLIDPSGNVVTNLGDSPYEAPADAQEWAEEKFRSMKMADLDTDTLADFAQLWIGDVDFRE